MHHLTPQGPRNLSAARATSDALLQRPALHGLEVTELPPHEGAVQWALAVALRDDDAAAFPATVPGALL